MNKTPCQNWNLMRETFVLKYQDKFGCKQKNWASKSDNIAQSPIIVMNMSLHNLKVHKQCQLATRNDTTTTSDMFIRPSDLTLKRILGIFDKYHGGKRRKELL